MQKDVKVGLVVGLVFVTALIVFLARQTGPPPEPASGETGGADVSEEWENRRLEWTAALKKQQDPEVLPGRVTETTVEESRLLDPDDLDTAPPDPVVTRRTETTETTPEPPVVELKGQPLTYVVKKGDTLSSIAREHYGDISKRKLIQKVNNLADPDRIVPGQKLILPAVEKAPAVEPPEGRTYTVKKGDTLWSIAERLLGDGKQWRRIQKANEGIISRDGTNLREGMTLVIPADERKD